MRNAPANVIGIDLGGTKVAAALVSPRGRILARRREPTELREGWPGLKAQLLRLCRELTAGAGNVAAVGIGSAGPLHAPSGTLLDPTNFGWRARAPIPLTRELARALRLPVHLENDAASAILAEHWRGACGPDALVLTLGTGLGVGVVCEGRLVRGGRGLHPEGGHLLLRPGDETARCGCGNLGCAEAYLSGMHFERRAARALGGEAVPAAELVARARRGDRRVRELFDEYAGLLALYLHDLVVLYYPKKVVFTGSFAEAHPLFLPAARAELRRLLRRRLRTIPLLPELRASKLGADAGVLGGAFVALRADL